MNIQDVSIDELLFDRQESFNDITTLLMAKIHGAPYDEARLYGNLKIIKSIIIECERRGFDPSQYDQIIKAKQGN